jgi:hypothetical protein
VAGRLLLPALPLGRRAPWVLAVIAAAALGWGAWQGDAGFILLGAVGLAGVVLALPLTSRLLSPPPAAEPSPEEDR